MSARTIALVLPLLLGTAAHAQQPPTQPPGVPPTAINPATPGDVMLITQGWLLLSQGSAAAAAERARQVLARSPHSPAASALAIEAEIVRGGASAGLTEYERLLGSRAFEEPLLLRRVAHAGLREAAAQTADVPARLNALSILAAVGDEAAAATLRASMSEGDLPATSALAEAGDPAAVRAMIDKVKAGALEPARGLRTLSKVRQPEAVTFATTLLGDSRSEVRLAAIEALRDQKAEAAIPKLRPLLDDPRSFIRIAAAEALLAAGDESGLGILRKLAASESAEDRLKAVEALSPRKDDAWVQAVRGLTTATEPEVRLGAARLVASSDPALAGSIVDALTQDSNPAVRTMARDVAVRLIPWDLARLRRLLHGGALGDRVFVATRILELTR